MARLSEDELVVLGKCPLFREMEVTSLWAAVSDEGCRAAGAEKGRVIYDPHDFSRSLGVILSGRVRVSKEGFVVSVLGPGEVFGAAALYNSKKDYATTLTAQTACRIVFFSQDLMSQVIGCYPTVTAAYIRYLSGRIRFLEGKLDALLAPSAQRRLSRYLLERCRDDTVVLDCPMNGLASRLDLGRTSLYRAFEALVAAGAIEKTGKTVRILKEEALL